jgi:hypothetical protein
MSKFGSKYGDVRKYYPKPDVAIEVPLWQILLGTAYITWRPKSWIWQKKLEANRHAMLLWFERSHINGEAIF